MRFPSLLRYGSYTTLTRVNWSSEQILGFLHDFWRSVSKKIDAILMKKGVVLWRTETYVGYDQIDKDVLKETIAAWSREAYVKHSDYSEFGGSIQVAVTYDEDVAYVCDDLWMVYVTPLSKNWLPIPGRPSYILFFIEKEVEGKPISIMTTVTISENKSGEKGVKIDIDYALPRKAAKQVDKVVKEMETKYNVVFMKVNPRLWK